MQEPGDRDLNVDTRPEKGHAPGHDGNTPQEPRARHHGISASVLGRQHSPPVERFVFEDLDEVFSRDFDPAAPTGTIRPMVEAEPTQYHPYRPQDNNGQRLWILNPRLFKDYADLCGWSAEFCNTTLGEVLDIIQVRRALNLPVRLPNGQMAWPGLGTPPSSTVITEELHYQPRYAAEVALRADVLVEPFRRDTPRAIDRNGLKKR